MASKLVDLRGDTVINPAQTCLATWHKPKQIVKSRRSG